MVVRKRKFRYLILLTAGLLAVNMPLSAQAEDMAVETEIKVPVEEKAAEDLKPAAKEALKKKEVSDEENSKSEDMSSLLWAVQTSIQNTFRLICHCSSPADSLYV